MVSDNFFYRAMLCKSQYKDADVIIGADDIVRRRWYCNHFVMVCVCVCVCVGVFVGVWVCMCLC